MRLRLRAACRMKSVWNVVDPTVSEVDEDVQKAGISLSSNKQKASAIIISELGNVPLRIVN